MLQDDDVAGRAAGAAAGARRSAASPTRSPMWCSRGPLAMGWSVGVLDRQRWFLLVLLVAVTYLFITRRRHLGH